MGRKTMWRCPAFFLLCTSILLGSIILSALPAANAATIDYGVPRSCNSTDGRCGAEEVMVEEEEAFQLDSEVNRRLLASQPPHLTNNALAKDRSVCDTNNGGRYNNGKCYPARSGKKADKIPCYYHNQRC